MPDDLKKNDDWCQGKLNGVEGFVPKSYISEKPHEYVL